MSTMTINGAAYDLDELVTGADLNHLLYLKQKMNMGMKTLITSLQRLETTAAEHKEIDGQTPEQKAEQDNERAVAFMAVFEDIDVLNAFRAIVWLARARAGDRGPDGSYLSVDSANEGVSLMNLFGGADAEVDSDAPKDPDPVAPPAGGLPAAF